MIKKLYMDGDISVLKDNRSFMDIIDELEESSEEYYLGVDYAGLYSQDKSMISTFKKNNDGSWQFVSSREFIVGYDIDSTIISYSSKE